MWGVKTFDKSLRETGRKEHQDLVKFKQKNILNGYSMKTAAAMWNEYKKNRQSYLFKLQEKR